MQYESVITSFKRPGSEEEVPLYDVDCFLSCSDISYGEVVRAGTELSQANGHYRYVHAIGRGEACNEHFGFAGEEGFVHVKLVGFFRDFELKCTCGSTTSPYAVTPINRGGPGSDFCVDIDLGSRTSDLNPVQAGQNFEYAAEITGLTDITCNIECDGRSPYVKVWSDSCDDEGTCTSTYQLIDSCGGSYSMQGEGRVEVLTPSFYKDAIVRCTCSSVALPNPTPAAPASVVPDKTDLPPTPQEPPFDAASEDPNWPGETIEPEFPWGKININVQYDDYPSEVDWVFEEYTGAEELSAISRSSNDGDWVVVEQFVGADFADDVIGQLVSYPQTDLSQESRYRFTITDSGGDGVCCSWGTKGWIAFVGGDGVLWSIPGDKIGLEPTTVDFYVDGLGTVRVIERGGNGASEAMDTTSTPGTGQPTAYPTAGVASATLSPTEAIEFEYVGNNGDPAEAFPLQACQADCGKDSECSDGLTCHQRDNENDPVPGCVGTPDDSDYCVMDPDGGSSGGNLSPTLRPVSAPRPNDDGTGPPGSRCLGDDNEACSSLACGHVVTGPSERLTRDWDYESVCCPFKSIMTASNYWEWCTGLPPGSYCLYNRVCVSGKCIENKCASDGGEAGDEQPEELPAAAPAGTPATTGDSTDEGTGTGSPCDNDACSSGACGYVWTGPFSSEEVCCESGSTVTKNNGWKYCTGLHLGSYCQDDEVCESGKCFQTECINGKADGEPCSGTTAGDECAGGACGWTSPTNFNYICCPGGRKNPGGICD